MSTCSNKVGRRRYTQGLKKVIATTIVHISLIVVTMHIHVWSKQASSWTYELRGMQRWPLINKQQQRSYTSMHYLRSQRCNRPWWRWHLQMPMQLPTDPLCFQLLRRCCCFRLLCRLPSKLKDPHTRRGEWQRTRQWWRGTEMDARARFYLEGELALVVPSLLAILPPYSAPRLVASASSTFSLKISSNSRAHLQELRIKLLLLTNFELNSSNNESKSLRITQSFSNTHVMSHITTYKLCLNKPKSFCCNCVLSLTTELNFFTPQICSLKQIYSQKKLYYCCF